MTALYTPRPREADLEAFFNAKVRAVGGIALKLMPTKNGAPDRLALLPGGQVSLVELKTESGPIRPIQQLWHSRAADIGVVVPILKGRGEVLAWLRDRCDIAYGGLPATPAPAPAPTPTYESDIAPLRAYAHKRLREVGERLEKCDPGSAWGRYYTAEKRELEELLA